MLNYKNVHPYRFFSNSTAWRVNLEVENVPKHQNWLEEKGRKEAVNDGKSVNYNDRL